jgi:DUF971 family protein
MKESLDSYFDECMDSHTTEEAGIFDWEYLQKVRAIHNHGAADYSYELFSIMMFDTWHRQYILGEELRDESSSLGASA